MNCAITSSNHNLQSHGAVVQPAQAVPEAILVAAELSPNKEQEDSAEPSEKAGRLQCQYAKPQLGQPSPEAGAVKVDSEPQLSQPSSEAGTLKADLESIEQQPVHNLQQVHNLLCSSVKVVGKGDRLAQLAT